MTGRSAAATLRRALDALVSFGGLTMASLRTPMPRRGLEQRLAELPLTGLPIAAPISVRWNEHLVPFIEAQSDDDLAFALGYVQAHLRLGHLMMTKHVARGRLAECLGPVAAEIDVGLRTLGFGDAAAANAAALPEASRRWVQRYCDGINRYLLTIDPLPHDVAVWGLNREPMTVEDVMTMGRLVGNDINWATWLRLLRYRDRPDWPSIWADALAYGGAARADGADPKGDESPLEAVLEGVGRNGSNAIAIGAARSATGAALMAGDPHVGIFLPALWMIMGLASPTQRAVGLLIPGVPMLLVGRNADICWGATNMRAASSDLVGVAGLPVTTRTERIAVRWGRTREVTVRRTEMGPIVSDLSLFPKAAAAEAPVSLRWAGHGVTDEISAILRVMRASEFGEWRDALSHFGVSGQNFLYADRHGRIGQVMAVHLPGRSPEPPAGPVLTPETSRGWDVRYTANELPHAFEPAEGYLVSANNQAAPAAVLIGSFFAAPDRIERLHALVGARRDWTIETLAPLQTDVIRGSALVLRDHLLTHLDAVTSPEAVALIEGLRNWDGAYDADRHEPVALEILAHELSLLLGDEMGALADSEGVLEVITHRLDGKTRPEAVQLIETAASRAARKARRVRSWGEWHRLKLAHVMTNLPLVGWRYPKALPPVSGSTTTLMKTAHDLVRGRHGVSFGANARHLFDMADPDRSWFVVLGGQDGDVGGAQHMDQLPLWQAGRTIQMPLRPESVRAAFRHETVLLPAA